jgi:hypothetical protein
MFTPNSYVMNYRFLISRTIALLPALVTTSCFSPVQDHSDFKSGRSIFSPKTVTSVTGRSFTTEFSGSFDLNVTGLPGKINPLSFIIGRTTVEDLKPGDNVRPWKGKLRIEALANATSKPLGWVIWNPDKEYVERRETSAALDSFVLRISILEPFDPHMDVSLIFGMRMETE